MTMGYDILLRQCTAAICVLYCRYVHMKGKKQMKKTTSTKFLSAVCAAAVCAVMMTGCTDSADSSSDTAATSEVQSSSSAAEESIAESSAAQTDSSDSTSDSSASDQNTEPSDITPAMWIVTADNGAQITMLGSMHALSDSDYPLPAKITDAFDSADILAVECDTTTTNNLTFQAALLKEMTFDNGDTLKDHISEEGYNALSDYLETYGMNVAMYDTYKPWAVANVTDSLPILFSDLKADLGIDAHFLELAHDNNKEIYEVESVDFQMDLLMNYSEDIYDLTFRSLKGETKDTQVKSLDELHEAWRTGDVDKIVELNTDEEDTEELSEKDQKLSDEYYKTMITDRNVTMENAVKELLSDGKNVFYVVGAAHYVGEGGIIDLLEKDGYTVEQVKY